MQTVLDRQLQLLEPQQTVTVRGAALDLAHHGRVRRHRADHDGQRTEYLLDVSGAANVLADSDAHIVPGHDPMVLRSYPAVGQGDAEIVALHASR